MEALTLARRGRMARVAELARGRSLGAWLLVLLALGVGYAAFAGGAIQIPDETRLQLGIAAAGLLAGIGIAIGGLRVPRAPLAWAGLAMLTVFALWSSLSAAWSASPDGSWIAGNRAFAYAAVAAIALLAAASVRRAALLTGVALFGVSLLVALYALGGKVVPDLEIAGLSLDPGSEFARLREPIGYWNALGLLLASGLLLGVGLVLHANAWLRLLAGAALAPLSVALYLTYSRGALLALVLGLLVLVLTERRVTAALPRGRLLAGIALAVVAAIAVAALVREGGPSAAADRALQAFRQEAPSGAQEGRLLSVSGHGRSDYWRVAARIVERDPLLGEGAGGFERRWMQERSAANNARDAHNLYLETLAELGPVGLALLLVALGAPLTGLRRARESSALVPAVTAAYAAFLVHAAVDWDWEVPVLVLPALACGAILLAEARPAKPTALTAPLRAIGVTAAAGAIAVALVAHVGNRSVAEAAIALELGDTAGAAEAAERAKSWAPWSHQPWQLLGEAQLAERRDAAARKSLKEGIRRAPEEWRLWFDLAIVTRGPQARVSITRARELNPLGEEVLDLVRR
jgi:O-antigen ligase